MPAGVARPHLAAILVGHDGGSETYVANKVKSCAECGFTSSLIRFEGAHHLHGVLHGCRGLHDLACLFKLREQAVYFL